MSDASRPGRSPRIVIIGTGFGGLGMAIRLKREGIHSFTILEKAEGLGGTWRDNDYPGAACDVQSHLYSFSFERNPSWSRMFAPQREIKAYMERCAEKYGLHPHFRFGAEVTAARFEEASNEWTLTLASGEQLTADMVVTATGGLSRPAYPRIPGIEKFEGKMFHSARWDHSYALEGKEVGVVGTGASAIQFVPQIAPRSKQLHLFQRTPPWVLPKPDRAIGAREQAVYGLLPFVQWLYRVLIYWLLELRVLGFAVHPKLMAFPQRMALAYLARTVADPVLRAKLTPSYTIGCKRILMSNEYLQSLAQPNVEVVDTAIREITRDGVITRDGKHRRLDALILGTGFQVADMAAPFEIRGRRGIDLKAHWGDAAEAYLGTTVAGFPNLFFMTGPNTGLGHSSMIFMIESQIEHILGCVREVGRRGARTVEVREDVQRRYTDGLQAKLRSSVWQSGCASWYQSASGKNTVLWPTFTFSFRRITRRVRAEDFVFGGALPQRQPEAASGSATPVVAEA